MLANWSYCKNCLYRESASCTHVSGLFHALVAVSPSEKLLPTIASPVANTTSQEETLPVTSFACSWKAPCKRKESNAKISEICFKKHVYGRQVKHNLQSLNDFDPRPSEYREMAQTQLQTFLSKAKGKGLGVSMLFDHDCRVWKAGETVTTIPGSQSMLPSKETLMERVKSFKESLKLTPEKIREIERSTTDQVRDSLWYSVRRYRLTASMFGRVYHRRPSTPPDSLVKEILHPQQFSSKATEWGKKHESVAFQKYVEHQLSLGHNGLVAVKAGFVVCEEYPFLGASPDGFVHDPTDVSLYGLLEIKCPFKYRNLLPEDAASHTDFCSSVHTEAGEKILKAQKKNHIYYSQVQGQMAIAQRK